MPFLNKFIAASLPYVPKTIIGQFSKKYIAGTTLSDALSVVRRFNRRGMMSTLDLLGEDVLDADRTKEMQQTAVTMFRQIKAEQLDSNVSIKLTQLGLRIDKDCDGGSEAG
jgi:proline dehydrogenase